MKPKIYLPYSVTSEQAEFVIAHERTHIKRLDYLVKPLCLFISIFHWFNPFVWIAFWLMNKDMEYSCDEAAVRWFDADSKKDYCNALLQFALKDESYKMSTVMFCESDCSGRIKNVLGSKRPYKLIAELLVLAVLAATIGCSAQNKEPTAENQFADMSFAQLEEYLPQSDDDRIDILQAMDCAENKEIEQFLAEEISAYLAETDFAELKDISVQQDHLTLCRDKNKKPLKNGIVNITLELLPYETLDIKTEAENNSRALWEHLDEYSKFIHSKTTQLEIKTLNENGHLVHTFALGENDEFDNPDISTIHNARNVLYAQQSSIELSAQKQAFNCFGSDRNFLLRKFGIPTGTKQLYIEYYIEDDYFLKDSGELEEKLSSKTAALNDLYADICEKVILHNDVQQYITDNGIETAIIAFRHRFLENGIAEFNVTVNKEEPVFDHDITNEDSLTGEDYEDFLKAIDSSYKYRDEQPAFAWPTASGGVRISRGFAGQYPSHDGVDIAGPLGTEIYAAADGVVETGEEDPEFNGKYIILDHGNGYRTLYAHCDKLLVNEGETVEKGQLIALMGTTGVSTGVHLHFGIIDQNGNSLDPYQYL